MEHFKILEFNLHDALLSELTRLLDTMSPASLSDENLAHVEEGQGIYELYYRNELVYVGKTDMEAGLKRRLQRHLGKVASRQRLDPKEVQFKAVRIYVFAAMDLETALLKHYKRNNKNLAWNKSGFGSNDPGRKRDHTALKKSHFDLLYPIDLSISVNLDSSKVTSAAAALGLLKENLPYTVRFQGETARSKKPHSELVDTAIELPRGPQAVHSILRIVAAALGKKWQVTALPGHVIVYRERTKYDHGTAFPPTGVAPASKRNSSKNV